MSDGPPAVQRRPEIQLIPLNDVRAYPDRSYLDKRFWALGLCPNEKKTEVRVWAAIPDGEPTLEFDRDAYAVRGESTDDRRWLDYGIVSIEDRLHNQLAIRDLNASDCQDSFVLLSSDRNYDPAGQSIPAVERECWGLAREDAGYTELRPSTIEVGASTEFTVRFTAGTKLPANASVRFLVPTAFSDPQTEIPGAPGYTEITDTDVPVQIEEIGPAIESHMRTAIHCILDQPMEPDEGFELSFNTDDTYLWPHRFSGASLPFWHADVPPLAASVAVDQDKPLVWLQDQNGHALEHEAGRAERLHLFLPGRRPADELSELTLTGTYTDRFRNAPPMGPVQTTVDLELEPVDGGEPISLAGPAECFEAFHRFEVPLPALSPGIYRAVARDERDGDVVARSNPLEVLPTNADRDPLYWGVIHVHTQMSDGTGDYAEMYQYGRDEAAMDFYAGTDHLDVATENDWEIMQDVTNAFHDPGTFCTLQAHEWCDRNTYTSRDRLEYVELSAAGRTGADTDPLYDRFSDRDDVVIGPHHLFGVDWDEEPEARDLLQFVEIYGTFGARDTHDSPYLPLNEQEREARGTSVNEMLATHDRKVGFTAGGDIHNGRGGFSAENPERQGDIAHDQFSGHPYRDGLTAMVAPELERTPLINALRSRDTYGTTGARILMDFAVSGIQMGKTGTAEEAMCAVDVHAVSPLEEVRILKDGEVVHTASMSRRDASVEWRDPETVTEERNYYAMAVQEDGQRAWASPVWITPE